MDNFQQQVHQLGKVLGAPATGRRMAQQFGADNSVSSAPSASNPRLSVRVNAPRNTLGSVGPQAGGNNWTLGYGATNQSAIAAKKPRVAPAPKSLNASTAPGATGAIGNEIEFSKPVNLGQSKAWSTDLGAAGAQPKPMPASSAPPPQPRVSAAPLGNAGPSVNVGGYKLPVAESIDDAAYRFEPKVGGLPEVHELQAGTQGKYVPRQPAAERTLAGAQQKIAAAGNKPFVSSAEPPPIQNTGTGATAAGRPMFRTALGGVNAYLPVVMGAKQVSDEALHQLSHAGAKDVRAQPDALHGGFFQGDYERPAYFGKDGEFVPARHYAGQQARSRAEMDAAAVRGGLPEPGAGEDMPEQSVQVPQQGAGDLSDLPLSRPALPYSPTANTGQPLEGEYIPASQPETAPAPPSQSLGQAGPAGGTGYAYGRGAGGAQVRYDLGGDGITRNGEAMPNGRFSVLDESAGREMAQRPYGNALAHQKGMEYAQAGRSYEEGYNQVAPGSFRVAGADVGAGGGNNPLGVVSPQMIGQMYDEAYGPSPYTGERGFAPVRGAAGRIRRQEAARDRFNALMGHAVGADANVQGARIKAGSDLALGQAQVDAGLRAQRMKSETDLALGGMQAETTRGGQDLDYDLKQQELMQAWLGGALDRKAKQQQIDLWNKAVGGDADAVRLLGHAPKYQIAVREELLDPSQPFLGTKKVPYLVNDQGGARELGQQSGQAPAAALEYLKKNPGAINAFVQKYGYRPQGF